MWNEVSTSINYKLEGLHQDILERKPKVENLATVHEHFDKEFEGFVHEFHKNPEIWSWKGVWWKETGGNYKALPFVIETITKWIFFRFYSNFINSLILLNKILFNRFCLKNQLNVIKTWYEKHFSISVGKYY